MPKLSVITINYNNAAGLDKTIQSVLSQSFKDFEYIIIDGGSTDNSKEVIKKYSDQLSYWVSQKDKGIYNAQNKGLEEATGEYCLFLNSGDYLAANNVLEKIFSSGSDVDIIYGDMIIDRGNGKLENGKMPDTISFYQMYSDTLWHPVSFIRKKLFDQYGKYNEKYKIVADYDFFFRVIVMHNVVTKHIPVHVTVFDMKGISSDKSFKELERKERAMVVRSYLPDKVIEFAEEIYREELRKNKKIINRIRRKLNY